MRGRRRANEALEVKKAPTDFEQLFKGAGGWSTLQSALTMHQQGALQQSDIWDGETGAGKWIWVEGGLDKSLEDSAPG